MEIPKQYINEGEKEKERKSVKIKRERLRKGRKAEKKVDRKIY
jgi:hypothetical protein